MYKELQARKAAFIRAPDLSCEILFHVYVGSEAAQMVL